MNKNAFFPILILIFGMSLHAQVDEDIMVSALMENQTHLKYHLGLSLTGQQWHKVAKDINQTGLAVQPFSATTKGVFFSIRLVNIPVTPLFEISADSSFTVLSLESIGMSDQPDTFPWTDGYSPPVYYGFEGLLGIDVLDTISVDFGWNRFLDTRTLWDNQSYSDNILNFIAPLSVDYGNPYIHEEYNQVWPTLAQERLSFYSLEVEISNFGQLISLFTRQPVSGGNLYNIRNLGFSLKTNLTKDLELKNPGFIFNTGLAFIPFIQIYKSDFLGDFFISSYAEIPVSLNWWVRPIADIQYSIKNQQLTHWSGTLDCGPALLFIIVALTSGETLEWNKARTDSFTLNSNMEKGDFFYSFIMGSRVNYESLPDSVADRIFPLSVNNIGGLPKGYSYGMNISMTTMVKPEKTGKTWGMNFEISGLFEAKGIDSSISSTMVGDISFFLTF